jgi:hypothetical protein
MNNIENFVTFNSPLTVVDASKAFIFYESYEIKDFFTPAETIFF